MPICNECEEEFEEAELYTCNACNYEYCADDFFFPEHLCESCNNARLEEESEEESVEAEEPE